MLFMLLVKASTNAEAGNLPSETLRQAMSMYNQSLVEAGIRIMAKGLHPTSEGVRIYYPDNGQEPRLEEGPFKEAKDQLAGFILIDVHSKEEALAWALKMPDPQGNGEGQIELRQVFE